MPAEEDKGSLQDLLRELLASTPPEEASPAVGEEVEAGTEGAGQGEEAAGEETPGIEDATPVGKEGASPTPEPATPEVASAPAFVGDAFGESTAPDNPPQPEAGSVPVHLEGTVGAAARVLAAESVPVHLEGTLEVKVAPPIPPNRLSFLERALREREGVVWLGTWGRPREGVTLRLRLKGPVTPAQLFEGVAVVERLEPAKKGQVQLLKVTMAPEGGQVGEAVPASEASAPPAAPEGPKLPEPQSIAVPRGSPVEITAGQVDLEVTPIASLEALNRLERLLSALSPGCRVTNVLSLDGVSAILVTLEGIDAATLARKLQESISAIKLEVRPDRLVAELPAKW